MISHEKYSTLNLYINTTLKQKFAVVYKIGITAGLTSIREVAALFSPTRIIFKVTRLSTRRSSAANQQSIKRG